MTLFNLFFAFFFTEWPFINKIFFKGSKADFLEKHFFLPEGGSDERGGLPDRAATGNGVRGLQHWRLFCRQRVNHGQWPQGPARSRWCRQASVRQLLNLCVRIQTPNSSDLSCACADTGKTWDTWSFTSPAARTCRSSVWCPGSRSTTSPTGWSSSLKAWSTILCDKRPSSLETSSRRYGKSECLYADWASFCEPTHNLVIDFLSEQCHIKIISAYGSMKDISVYNMLGLSPSQIYIVGRPSKKYQNQCQVVWSSSEFVFHMIFSDFHCDLVALPLDDTFSSWAMAMQHTSPRFSLDTEPDLRSPPPFAWFWGKVPLVSQRSQTSCVSAPTWEGPCQCSSRTRRARPTPSPSALKASRSLTRITVVREQEAEEELVAAAAGRWLGVGPPCSGETPLPDRKEAEGLIGEKGNERRFSMSRVKVRSVC